MYLFLLLIAGLIFFGFFRRNNLVQQVELFNRLLYKDKSPEKYTQEIDRLLSNIQSDRERSINFIQKTTGLLYLGKFEEAINILTEKIKKIPPNWQHVYYHNLILCLYLNNEVERANEILKEAKDVLDVYAKKDYNKAAIDMIYAVADIYNGGGSKSKDFFIDLSQTGRNDYRIAFGYYFLSKIYELENKLEESEENLEKARTFGQGSFIENI